MSKHILLLVGALTLFITSCCTPSVVVKSENREAIKSLDNFRVLVVSFDTELSKEFTPLFNQRLAKSLVQYGACVEQINIPYQFDRSARLKADSLQNNFKPEFILTTKIISERSNIALNAVSSSKTFSEATYYLELKSSITEKPVWTGQAIVNNLKRGDDTKTIYRLTKRVVEQLQSDMVIQNIRGSNNNNNAIQ